MYSNFGIYNESVKKTNDRFLIDCFIKSRATRKFGCEAKR